MDNSKYSSQKIDYKQAKRATNVQSIDYSRLPPDHDLSIISPEQLRSQSKKVKYVFQEISSNPTSSEQKENKEETSEEHRSENI